MAILEDVIVLQAHEYLAKFCERIPHLRDIIVVTKVVDRISLFSF
jgi:hypothetical protein